MMQVFNPCAAMYVDVVNKHLQELTSPFFEGINHNMWKCVCGIFHPKGHHVPFIQTRFGDQIIFFTSLEAMGIYQKPDYKSNVKNHLKLPIWLRTSLSRGMGKKSCLVWEFNGQ
jgi:hypothetical protein